MIKFRGKDDGIRTRHVIEPKTSRPPACGFFVGGWPCEATTPDHEVHFVNDLSAKQIEMMEEQTKLYMEGRS